MPHRVKADQNDNRQDKIIYYLKYFSPRDILIFIYSLLTTGCSLLSVWNLVCHKQQNTVNHRVKQNRLP